MVAIAKSVRRAMIDRLARALTDCDDVTDSLPFLISAKYGDRLISTAMGRLSGNCEVVYDFASQEFGTGRWVKNPVNGRDHYSGSAPLADVLPFMYEGGEDEPRRMPIFSAVWNGYEYEPEITDWEDDWDHPITSRGKWHEYRSNIAQAIAAVVVSLLCVHAETPPESTYGSLLENWFRAELRKPAPERRVMSAGEWLQGYNGVVAWKGYPDRGAVGILLPWELSTRVTPPIADNPIPPNHRECTAGLPIAGYHSRRSGIGGYDNVRYQAINTAFYDLRRAFDIAGQYGSVEFNAALNVHYNYQDTILDDRAALTFLRSHGVTV